MVSRPTSAIVVASSWVRISMTCATSSAPAAARPAAAGRPTSTTRAPSASAISALLPLRTPPSNTISAFPATAATISSSTSSVAGHGSSWRPPWLDTYTAAAPASTARRASSPHITPFTATGTPAEPMSSASCAHVRAGRSDASPPWDMFAAAIRSAPRNRWRSSRRRTPTTGTSTVTQSAA